MVAVYVEARDGGNPLVLPTPRRGQGCAARCWATVGAGTPSTEPSGRVPRAGLPRQGGGMLVTRTLVAAALAASGALLATAAPWPAAAIDSPPWQPPVTPAVVARAFDGPAAPWLPGHRGVDLHTSVGSAVVAPAAGTVVFAGSVAGRGVLTLDHGVLRTSYLPINALVTRGDTVAAGTVVGTVGTGAGHCGDGGCLHMGLRRGAEYLNPMLMLSRPTARLVPW